jgi:hypothetical protein
MLYERTDKFYELDVLPVRDTNEPAPETITTIMLSNFNPHVQIGNIFSVIGSPCDVVQQTGTLELEYYDGWVEVIPDGSLLRPTSQVETIMLNSASNNYCDGNILDGRTGVYSWRGFRDYP